LRLQYICRVLHRANELECCVSCKQNVTTVSSRLVQPNRSFFILGPLRKVLEDCKHVLQISVSSRKNSMQFRPLQAPSHV
jgi:hypothetical protein